MSENNSAQIKEESSKDSTAQNNKELINNNLIKSVEVVSSKVVDTFDTIDTNDTNDTNDTERKSIKRIKSIPYQDTWNSPEILPKIMRLLKQTEYLSYENIGITVSITPEYAKTVMNRNKEFFQEMAKEGSKKLFGLSETGKRYLEEIEKRHEQITEKLAKSFGDEERRLVDKTELIEEVTSILGIIKPRFNGNLITFDFNSFLNENPAFAERVLNEPDEVFKIIKEKYDNHDLEICIKNLPKSQTITIESIRSNHLNKLVSIEGRCVSMSSVRPTIIMSKFECPSCGTLCNVLQTEFILEHPPRCSCGRKTNFKLIKNEMIDATNIILEDLQEKTDNPNTQRIKCRVVGELCKHEHINIFTPGNEIKVNGILREVKSFVNGQQVVNLGFLLEIINGEPFEEEVDVDHFTEEEKANINDLANEIDRNGLSALDNSFSPDIYGYEKIKEAIILQLCARRNDVKTKKVRNKPNILLIGDPGTAKSVLANFAVDITPGSRKAVGGGSSAVGITASVVKEEESMGGYRVEPGALVLAKELLVIDELNNLSDEDKPKLQEGMSENSVTVNKANLHVSLKVTSGILATANPMSGKFEELNEQERNSTSPWSKPKTIFQQFNIPIPIINRFDLIFVMRDKPNEEKDEQIAEIMLKRETGKIKPKYDKDFLRKFFVYIRKLPEPRISSSISKKLIKFYAKARRNNTSEYILNARFMESIMRLMKANAKLRLSEEVELKDIKVASDILKESYFQLKEYNPEMFEEQEEKKEDITEIDEEKING